MSYYLEISGRVVNGYAGANGRRRPLDKQGPTVVHQKPGPLQTIFDLLPDEVSWVEFLYMLICGVVNGTSLMFVHVHDSLFSFIQ